jgi:hypothetical protein
MVLIEPEADRREGLGNLDRVGATRGDDANPTAGCGDDPDCATKDLAAYDGLGFGEMGLCLKSFPPGTCGFRPHRHNLSFDQKKKPTWRNTPKVFDHVGLLVNEPPGTAGVPFV